MNLSSRPPRRVSRSVRQLALILLATVAASTPVTAQTFSVLHNFATGVGGAYPDGTVVVTNQVMYGVTGAGGVGSSGTVFRMNTDGTGFTNIYTFSPASGFSTNNDGVAPDAGLVLSGNTLYGTATSGGTGGDGTVFRVNTDGSGFTNLHNFVFSEGHDPVGGLVLVGNTLYGTTAFGGFDYANAGTIYSVNTDGTGFTLLHVFTTLNNDGGNSYAAMVASGGTLYGTTIGGGASGYGVVFAININGTGYATLHSFPGPSGTPQTEGIYPYAPLVIAGNMLYGTTYQGGDASEGVVFSLTTDGLTYTKLHDFTDASASPFTNLDGALPHAGLALSGDTLYGTTIHGGALGYGVLYALNTNGTAFTNLHSLTVNDGVSPNGGVFIQNASLYGMTHSGGSSNSYGSIYRLDLNTITAPMLTIVPSGTNVVLTWPTNPPGFTLEFTPSLTPPTVWTTNSPPPVIVNGQYTVTNISGGPIRFYRLIQ